MLDKFRKLFEKSIVFLSLIFVQFVFGGYSVLTKVALTDGVDPVIFSFLRDLLATPLLLLGAYYFEGLVRPKFEDLFWFVLLGLTGIFGNQLFFILGIDFTNSVNASLLQPSIPVFTTLLSLIFRLEKLNIMSVEGFLKILGIGCSVSGAVVVIALSGGEQTSSNIIAGNICLIINCMSFAVYALLQKRVLKKYPPVSTSAWSYAFGGGLLGISVLGCAGNAELGSRWNLPLSSLYALAYSSFLSSALCYGILSWCNNKTSPTIVTSFWPLQVVASVIFSAIFIDYKLLLSDILGASLVAFGLFCVIFAKYYEERRSQAFTSNNTNEPVLESRPLINSTLINELNDSHDVENKEKEP